jgi:hypothetical protein
MSSDFLSNKQMDDAVDRAEADTQAALARRAADIPNSRDFIYEVDVGSAVHEQFAKGAGVIHVLAGISDAMILHAIKKGIAMSKGMPFTVQELPS